MLSYSKMELRVVEELRLLEHRDVCKLRDHFSLEGHRVLEEGSNLRIPGQMFDSKINKLLRRREGMRIERGTDWESRHRC